MYLSLLKKILLTNKLQAITVVLLTFITALITYAGPQLQAYIINVIFVSNDKSGLSIVVLILLSLVIVAFLINYVSDVIVAKLQYEVVNSLKLDFIRTTSDLRLDDRVKWSEPELQAKFNEINNVSEILSTSIFKLFGALILSVLSLVYLAKISILGFILIIFFIPVSYIANIKSIDSVSKNYKDVMETNINVMSSFNNFIKNLTLFKTNFRVGEKEQEFKLEIDNITDKQVKSSKSQIIASSIITNFYGLLTAIFIAIYGYSVINGTLEIGDYVAAIQYVGLVYIPITLFAGVKLSVSPALVSYKRTLEFINQERSSVNCGTEEIEKIYRIKFENPKYKNYVSLDLSQELTVGDMYHLSGENGSGKSTIMKMLLSLFPIESGDILINNISISRINEKQIWENIHYVAQTTEIFKGTIMENICVEHQISQADLLDLINKYDLLDLFDGLNVNKQVDASSALSIGETKQIALLRFMISKKSVYIIDELAASLDKAWASKIENIIEDKLKNSIIIRIEHDDN